MKLRIRLFLKIKTLNNLMISNILFLYFLGLASLFFSYFVGLGLFCFRKVNLFMGLFLGYLLLIVGYAVVKGGGNSLGILVLLWIIGYFFIIEKAKDKKRISKKETLEQLGIISLIWTMIFALKANYFWNFEYDLPNLLFIDNEFYMKVAEGYNWSGNENAMGLKNVLFPFLNFAQPYRINDFWLVSLGLDLSKLNYPFGLIYYGKDLQNHDKEDYSQHDATFLNLFGRNYTVFNIEADSLKMDFLDKSNQKRNMFIQGNTLNIWLHNSNRLSKTNKKLTRKDFHEAYPFSFCISKISKDSLPNFIKSDIVASIKDANSKIYFYTLDRNSKQIKNINK